MGGGVSHRTLQRIGIGAGGGGGRGVQGHTCCHRLLGTGEKAHEAVPQELVDNAVLTLDMRDQHPKPCVNVPGEVQGVGTAAHKMDGPHLIDTMLRPGA